MRSVGVAILMDTCCRLVGSSCFLKESQKEREGAILPTDAELEVITINNHYQ